MVRNRTYWCMIMAEYWYGYIDEEIMCVDIFTKVLSHYCCSDYIVYCIVNSIYLDLFISI